MNIQDELKAFNEKQETREQKFREQKLADAREFVKNLLAGLRPKFVELATLINEITPDIRAGILADETISKAVKSFSKAKSSGKNKSGSRTSSKQLQGFAKDGKTEAEIAAEFSTVDSVRLKKEVAKKKLKFAGGKYFPA